MSSTFDANWEVMKSVSRSLLSSYNKSLIRKIFQMSSQRARMGKIGMEVQRAAGKALRCHGDSVYYHDGHVWKELSWAVFSTAIEDSFSGFDVPMGGFTQSELSSLVSKARSGVMMSPLRLRSSLVGFTNGVWDFSDFFNPVRHEFSEGCDITSVLPYAYDRTASCPLWESFLRQILTASQITVLQKFLGLGCVDRRSMDHKIEETLWLVGSGANGKSVVFDVVSGVYGEESISNVGLLNLVRGSGDDRARFVSAIVGKRFNYCTEVQADDISKYTDAFKALCSGEPQVVRRIGKNVEMARDIPFMVFNMNRMPKNRSIDYAVIRRLLTVRFRTTVRKEDVDQNLSARLRAEYSGIRNWMEEGYRKLVKDGYRFGDTGENARTLTEYMVDNGKTAEVYVRSVGYRPNRATGHDETPYRVLSERLYQEYVSFCEKMGYEAVSVQRFGRDLRDVGFEKNRTSLGYMYDIYSDTDIPFASKNTRI